MRQNLIRELSSPFIFHTGCDLWLHCASPLVHTNIKGLGTRDCFFSVKTCQLSRTEVLIFIF